MQPVTKSQATRTPEELIEVCLSNAETLVALDREGAYVGHGAVRSFEMDFREAAAALTEALTCSSHAYTGEALDQLTEARQERDRLREALLSLRNEAQGFLAMADVQTHGFTNINCLARRINEADAVLKIGLFDAILSRRVEQEADTRRAVLAEVREMIEKEIARASSPHSKLKVLRGLHERVGMLGLDALTADPQETP